MTDSPKKNAAAVALGRKGGRARGQRLSPEQRSEIARMGGLASAKLREQAKLNKVSQDEKTTD